MTTYTHEETGAAHLVAEWVSAFNTAVSSGEMDKAASLFLDAGYLRDSAILTWQLRTCRGRRQIEAMLRRAGDLVAPAELFPDHTEPSRATRN